MNKIDGWKIYNCALLPTTPPHEEPNVEALKGNKKWKWGEVLLVRYTTNFDCGYETRWWYCIKDAPMDISKLKAKRRYEINKGLKNILVKQINQEEYAEQISEILIFGITEYPYKYRPKFNKDKMSASIRESVNNQEVIYFGCFKTDSNELVGYSYCRIRGEVLELIEVKILPEHLSTNANAALICYICQEYMNTKKVKYICDGERNLRHETNYQDYLIKQFEFRKAYCKLNVQYELLTNIAISLLFPIRNMIRNTNNRMIYNVYCLLKQEEIRRSFIKEK